VCPVQGLGQYGGVVGGIGFGLVVMYSWLGGAIFGGAVGFWPRGGGGGVGGSIAVVKVGW